MLFIGANRVKAPCKTSDHVTSSFRPYEKEKKSTKLISLKKRNLENNKQQTVNEGGETNTKNSRYQRIRTSPVVIDYSYCTGLRSISFYFIDSNK